MKAQTDYKYKSN